MRLLKSWLPLSLFIASPAILSASPAWAQLYSGSFNSVTTDPNGAAIPGATATDQGFVFNAGSKGRYLERALPSGKHKLTARELGFQGEERTGFAIGVNQNVTISLTLPLATTRQSVEAISQAPELDAGRRDGPGDRSRIRQWPAERRTRPRVSDLFDSWCREIAGWWTNRGQGNNSWRLQ